MTTEERIENLKLHIAAAERTIERHTQAAKDYPEDAARFLKSVEVKKSDLARDMATLERLTK